MSINQVVVIRKAEEPDRIHQTFQCMKCRGFLHHQAKSMPNLTLEADSRLYSAISSNQQHPSIYGNYKAPLQGNYSEALPAQARVKIKVSCSSPAALSYSSYQILVSPLRALPHGFSIPNKDDSNFISRIPHKT